MWLELTQRMDRNDLITIDPDILGGTPVFKGGSCSNQDLIRTSLVPQRHQWIDFRRFAAGYVTRN